MIKYVELVQRPERNEQVDILTHQKWSGANLMDKQVGDDENNPNNAVNDVPFTVSQNRSLCSRLGATSQ